MVHAVAHVRAAILLWVHAAAIRAIEVTWQGEASCVHSLLVDVETLLFGADWRAEQVTTLRGRQRSHADDTRVSCPGHLTFPDLALGAFDGRVEVESCVGHRRLESTVTAAAFKRLSHVGSSERLGDLARRVQGAETVLLASKIH